MLEVHELTKKFGGFTAVNRISFEVQRGEIVGLIGHGAGHGQFDKLFATFKEDANLILNVDPVAAQLLDAKTLKPGMGALTAEMIKRYKVEVKGDEIPTHVSMGFNQTWILLSDVMPRAIKKYGGFDP